MGNDNRPDEFIQAMNGKASQFGIVGAGYYGLAHKGESLREPSLRFVVCFIMMAEFGYKEGIEQIVPVSELERMPETLFSQYADFILKKMEEAAAKYQGL